MISEPLGRNWHNYWRQFLQSTAVRAVRFSFYLFFGCLVMIPIAATIDRIFDGVWPQINWKFGLEYSLAMMPFAFVMAFVAAILEDFCARRRKPKAR
jgi:membrane protease YdiL (CAAX protease family)